MLLWVIFAWFAVFPCCQLVDVQTLSSTVSFLLFLSLSPLSFMCVQACRASADHCPRTHLQAWRTQQREREKRPTAKHCRQHSARWERIYPPPIPHTHTHKRNTRNTRKHFHIKSLQILIFLCPDMKYRCWIMLNKELVLLQETQVTWYEVYKRYQEIVLYYILYIILNIYLNLWIQKNN